MRIATSCSLKGAADAPTSIAVHTEAVQAVAAALSMADRAQLGASRQLAMASGHTLQQKKSLLDSENKILRVMGES